MFRDVFYWVIRPSYRLKLNPRLISWFIGVFSMRLWVPLKQMDDQRPRGITAIKHQEIVGVKFMELLKQHLPLAKIGAVEFCGRHHFQVWQIKAERDNLSKEAVAGILKAPAHFRGVGRDNTQIIPARGDIKWLETSLVKRWLRHAKALWENCLRVLEKAWAIAFRVKSAWLARWAKSCITFA